MRGNLGSAPWVVVVALASGSGCSFDTDQPAPHVPPPTQQGACGTTATLWPTFLQFLEEDGFAPLRGVLEARFLPSPENPRPSPSLRDIVAAGIRLIAQIGLEDTATVARVAARAELEAQLAPVLVTLLRFAEGRVDGRPRWEAAEATAFFVRRCDPDHLLTSVEHVLRLESASRGGPWLVVLLDELGEMVANPALQPFLDTFEENAERGRPAIISLLRQIMAFLADEGFAIERVETLLESAVYPSVDAALEARIRGLVVLLGEATTRDARVFRPLQEAMRCGMRYGRERDELLGFAYDLLASEPLGLDTLLDSLGAVRTETVVAELELFAELVRVLRSDPAVRDVLRETLAVMLSRPDVETVVPVLIDLFERRVMTELLGGLVRLLDGCGRG